MIYLVVGLAAFFYLFIGLVVAAVSLGMKRQCERKGWSYYRCSGNSMGCNPYHAPLLIGPLWLFGLLGAILIGVFYLPVKGGKLLFYDIAKTIETRKKTMAERR